MVFLGIIFEKPTIDAITSTGWTVLIYMTLIPMGLCYLTWFETLRCLPPATASTGMLLVPPYWLYFCGRLTWEPIGLRQAMAMTFTVGRNHARVAANVKPTDRVVTLKSTERSKADIACYRASHR